MPVVTLTVYVDGKRVAVEVDPREDLGMIAWQLEQKGYPIDPIYPIILMEGKRVTGDPCEGWPVVNLEKIYNFCK